MIHTARGHRSHQPWCRYAQHSKIIPGTGGLLPCKHCQQGILADGLDVRDFMGSAGGLEVTATGIATTEELAIPTLTKATYDAVVYWATNMLMHMGAIRHYQVQEAYARQQDYDTWLLDIIQRADCTLPDLNNLTIDAFNQLAYEDRIRCEYQLLHAAIGVTPRDFVYRHQDTMNMYRQIAPPHITRNEAGEYNVITSTQLPISTLDNTLTDIEWYIICYARPSHKELYEWEAQQILNEHARIIAQKYTAYNLSEVPIEYINDALQRINFISADLMLALLSKLGEQHPELSCGLTYGLDSSDDQARAAIWWGTPQPLRRLMHEFLHMISSIKTPLRTQGSNGFISYSNERGLIREEFNEGCTECLTNYMFEGTIYEQKPYRSGYPIETIICQQMILPTMSYLSLLKAFINGDYDSVQRNFDIAVSAQMDLNQIIDLLEQHNKSLNAFKRRETLLRLQDELARYRLITGRLL